MTKIFERSDCDHFDITMAENELNKIIKVNTDNKLFLATATVWNYDKTKPVYDFIANKMKIIFNID